MSLKDYYKKHVIGVIEPLYIDGIGEIYAKIDTGNDGYNVIDGQKIKINKDTVEFIVKGKRRVMKIHDFVDIHIGNSNIDHRPVVLLDIVFNRKRISNVPFSIANRKMNEQKVLIGKDFIADNGFLVDASR